MISWKVAGFLLLRLLADIDFTNAQPWFEHLGQLGSVVLTQTDSATDTASAAISQLLR